MMVRVFVVLIILLITSTLTAQKKPNPTIKKNILPVETTKNGICKSFKLWKGKSLPGSSEILLIEDAKFHVIKPYEYKKDNYRFLHGVALAWHKGKLYSSFAHNKGAENTEGEEARGRISSDGGKTWGKTFTIESGRNNLGISHGVFLSHGDNLWAFHGAYYDKRERVHTRAYVLNEDTGEWIKKGIVIDDGFWPMQEPQKMDNGNWIMAGFRVDKGFEVEGDLPAVAISHGNDFTKWDLVTIQIQDNIGKVWGESTVYLDGSKIINVSRWGEETKTLVACSNDFGYNWSLSEPSNLPMATSKPYCGVLSTGQYYLICTTTKDTGRKRSPLTIAVTRPGELSFSKIFIIRNAEFPLGPGESHPDAALSYPYAVEFNEKLYVGYSNSGAGVGRIGKGRELNNNNSAELAIIPVESLK